ncbi:MAG: adenine phosphoribosyltransferase [Anaerolineae bacterium]|nr:adenine phosphoribosyltransferase [Anaerolineae bacterium]
MTLWDSTTDYLRLVDTHTDGRRYDVTPLFADSAAFAAVVADLGRPFTTTPFDYVAGIDALGFVLGAALAIHLKKGFIPIRKGGKLPVATDRMGFVDYTGAQTCLELRSDAISPGARVLVVDEWIETGAQVKAAIELIELQGGTVVGVATINMDSNALTQQLRAKYNCHVLQEDG